MNSQEAKVKVLGEYLFEKGCLAAVTEGPWNSDVWVITKNMYSIDIEIKVNREDLLNELHTIAKTMRKDYQMRLRQRSAKLHKHQAYLDGNVIDRGELMRRPNSFYLAFPHELLDHRIEMLSGTPYGVLLIEPDGRIEVYKKASKIHQDKVTNEALIGLIRKTSTESYFLRAKLLERGVQYDVPKTE